MKRPGTAQLELLISYLKILLINASRIKIEHRHSKDESTKKEPVILNSLKDAIEDHFKFDDNDYIQMNFASFNDGPIAETDSKFKSIS